MVYNPLETKMIKNFKNNNIQTFNGLEMFIFQAQKSFSLWNNITPTVDIEIKEKITASLNRL